MLAALLSPTWGVYSGYELFEHVAVRPGSEEYLDSEKYQLRPRDWAAAEAQGRTLAPFLTRLNEIRRAHPALQQLRTLHFHAVDNPNLICFSKTDPGSVFEKQSRLGLSTEWKCSVRSCWSAGCARRISLSRRR